MVLRTLKADSENKAPSGLRRARAEQQKRRRTRVEHAARTAAHKRKAAAARCVTPDHARPLPSPPITDVEMADATPPPAPTRPIALPRDLRRPACPPVAPAALRAVGEVANAPFVRAALDQLGPRMRQVVQSVRVPCAPAAQVPRELAVIVNDRAAPAPTHMLAVHGPPPPPGAPRKVQLLPVHAPVLAAHCARLPPFAPAREHLLSSVPAALALPVRPVSLPAPAQCALLLGYLYVRDAQGLLHALLPAPLPPVDLAAPAFPVARCARAMARAHTPAALVGLAGRVHGLWQNACALGVDDDGLWAAMQLAWQVLLGAIAIATRVPERVGLEQELAALEREESARPACNGVSACNNGVSAHPISASP
ncbi:hypothetical protein HDZ31DRAFT_71692 [Schizophyllum fasciatum]